MESQSKGNLKKTAYRKDMLDYFNKQEQYQ